MNTYQGHMTWYSNLNLSHMLLVWSLSFVELLWPLLRFSSCIHDQDTRTPTNKLLTLTRRVTQKTCLSVHHKKLLHSFIMSLSQKFHVPKRIVWAMLKNKKREKKERKEKKSMPKGMRGKMHAKEHEEKKRKGKERNNR